MADCPFHVGGHARRECRLTGFNTTQWDIPNFTGCLSSEVELIYNNVIFTFLTFLIKCVFKKLELIIVFFYSFQFQFKRLTLGYDVTNGSVTITNLLKEVSKRPSFLPGECERVLDILSQVLNHLNSSLLFEDLRNSAEDFYGVIDSLLGHEHCFITEEVSKNFL